MKKQPRGSRKLSAKDYDLIRRTDSLHCSKYNECDLLSAQAESQYTKNYISNRKQLLKQIYDKK